MTSHSDIQKELEAIHTATEARRVKRIELQQAIAGLDRDDASDAKRVMFIASQLSGGAK